MRSFTTCVVFLGVMLFLTACGSDNSPDASGLASYNGGVFRIDVPASWEKVDVSNITVPVRGKFEVGFRSLVNKKGFMNNLTILSDTLETSVSSGEYARQSMLWAAREYESMVVEQDEVLHFSDGSTSQLGIFRAKYNETTQERLFFQTARVCSMTVYLITLGLSSDTETAAYDQYRSLLGSFSCPS